MVELSTSPLHDLTDMLCLCLSLQCCWVCSRLGLRPRWSGLSGTTPHCLAITSSGSRMDKHWTSSGSCRNPTSNSVWWGIFCFKPSLTICLLSLSLSPSGHEFCFCIIPLMPFVCPLGLLPVTCMVKPCSIWMITVWETCEVIKALQILVSKLILYYKMSVF